MEIPRDLRDIVPLKKRITCKGTWRRTWTRALDTGMGKAKPKALNPKPYA